MSIYVHSQFKRSFFLLFIFSLIETSTLFSQETQSNQQPEIKEGAGIITRDQAVAGPAWMYHLLPALDSSCVLILKDGKGNEVRLTAKDIIAHGPFYIPEGHKVTVEKGSYYWYGRISAKRAP